MKPSFLIRAFYVLAAAVSVAVLSGCCDGSCPDTEHTSRTRVKDGKDAPHTSTSGPHQHG